MFLQNQQLGGRRGIPVTLGMHHLRAFLRVQQQQGRSCGIIFLDLAFYRVLRPLAMHAEWTDEDIAGVAQRLRLPPSIVEDLYVHLQDPCAPSFLAQLHHGHPHGHLVCCRRSDD